MGIIQLVERFEKAAKDHSWKGSQPPEDWDLIEQEYRKAKQNLLDYMRLLKRRARKDEQTEI